MPTSPLSVVIQHLMADLRPDGDGLTDGELLARFLRSRDEDALAALVLRHAPMVWGVCSRLLHHRHDAEDAFQATFLVLVRKASDVPGQAVANWLYGVARQTAVRLRATAAKQRRRETQVVNMPEPTVAEVRDADLQIVLDEELSRLPDHYRGVIVLCDLECMTRREAARQLGIPDGSVASRLARARAMLAKRLKLRGVVFSSGSVAALLSSASMSASAPPALVASTIKVASLLAAGQAAGIVSVEVAALTEGVVKAMFVTKIKSVLAVVLFLGFVATGATLLTYSTAVGQDNKKANTEAKPIAEKAVEPSAKQQKGKEVFTAWGKEVDGVQIGIQLGKQRVYRVGETVTLTLRLRNNGKEKVPYRDDAEYFYKNPPHITDADGKAITIQAMSIFGFIGEMSVAPGKEVDLIQLKLALQPMTDRQKAEAWTLYGTGKFHIQYKDIPVVGEIRLGSPGIVLTTGKLELEVKEADDKKPIEVTVVGPDKKPITVPGWTSIIPPPYEEPLIKGITKENPDKKPTGEKPAAKQEEKDLGKIEPPGGVPLSLVEPGTKKIGVDQLKKVSKRLESVPVSDLEPFDNVIERWVVEMARITGMKMKDGPKQACRTYFAVHMSVAFDDLSWNAKSADKLYKRACTMPTKEATAWKEAFESLLKEKIGIKQAENDDEFTQLTGGPPWAVPLVLIPVDALHEGEKYSVERGKKYLARLKQLTKDDISLWSDKVDKFGGTELDAAVNIILLDRFFSEERFQRDTFKAAVERQQEKK